MFLNAAAERFTDRTHSQRAFEGRIALALMLDPSKPQISPTEVPGLLHLPMMPQARPFNLLHAKVAVLAFRHEMDVSQWCLRLIVSTGNWTMDTLNQSLDLAWTVELSSEDVNKKTKSLAQTSADVAAAWDMIAWLTKLFDTRVLDARRPDRKESSSRSAANCLETWVESARKFSRGAAPQFFDNRTRSLLDALPKKIGRHTNKVARNYLAMGSGFYDSACVSGEVPRVLKQITDKLKSDNLLTRKPEVDVFVNPKSCQSIAGSVTAIHKIGWTVREAWQPPLFNPNVPRSLHAKFLFSFNYRAGSSRCNSGWLYLGSGNLTHPGFTQKMSPSGGNLEAGVVINAEVLQWDEKNKVVKPPLLPIQQNTDLRDQVAGLEAGADMPPPEDVFIAPPISYLFWRSAASGGWLTTSDESVQAYEVLDASDAPCHRDAQHGLRWLGSMPRQVRVRWQFGDESRHALVAVIDEMGRLAATSMPSLDLEEAWSQLANFPMPPDDEDITGDGGTVSGATGGGEMVHQPATARYPVREMMQLIENIATKQTAVQSFDWSMWCTRLEQCLIQAKESVVLKEFCELRLNPLSPLWHRPFRPEYALDGSTPEGEMYEQTLKMIETAWGVVEFAKLGESK